MLKLLCLITNEDSKREKQIKKVFKDNKLLFNFISSAVGTASTSILDYFGLDDIEKKVYITIIPGDNGEIFSKLTKDLKLKKHGEGICFTIPITGSNKYVNDMVNKNKEDKKMNYKEKYSLVITSVLEGYCELVMSAAKKYGATGGTIISGRSFGTGTNHFLKMNIEAEKDVVLIVVPDDVKEEIMAEITKKAGIKTEAKGMCLSVPIADISGLVK